MDRGARNAPAGAGPGPPGGTAVHLARRSLGPWRLLGPKRLLTPTRRRALDPARPALLRRGAHRGRLARAHGGRASKRRAGRRPAARGGLPLAEGPAQWCAFLQTEKASWTAPLFVSTCQPCPWRRLR